MKTFAATLLVAGACALVEDPSKHWAVIMAGSNTYSNYRHQADSHHAVKIMLENGIPRDQIIHMAYDDVANNRYNPFPGQLFNKPTAAGVEGVNVYSQDEIDYSGSAVNKANFFNVLLGGSEENGPTLGSDSESRVFVYFVDHGGVGLICTPQGSQDWIYADELDSTLQQMKDNNMFKELVFYVEACESGSMFPNLNEDENIFALTASNASQSSWGAYCGSEATINGTSIGSCLGDLFSINWMEDTEANSVTTETLATQVDTVTKLTTRSPVQQFGNKSFLNEVTGNFQGDFEASNSTATEKIFGKFTDLYKKVVDEREPSKDHVSSRDHDLHFYYNRVMSHGTEEDYTNLQNEIDHRQFIDNMFATIFPAEEYANAPENPQNFDCLRMMVGGVEEMCGNWSAYSLQYVRNLANACDTKTADEVSELYVQVGQHCGAF